MNRRGYRLRSNGDTAPSGVAQAIVQKTKAGLVILSALSVAISACSEPQDRAAPPGTTSLVPKPSAARTEIGSDQSVNEVRALLEAGAVNEAVNKAWSHVRNKPKSLDARLSLATAYTVAGQHERALQEAEAAILLDAEAIGPWLTKGVALQGLGKTTEAIEVTLHAQKRDATNPAPWRNLARYYAANKDLDSQQLALTRLVTLAPNDALAHLDMARLLRDKGALEDAAKHARQAADILPDLGEAHLLAGLIAYESERFLEAMDRAEITSRVAPDRDEASALFRAAFYVHVASQLHCRHGSGPWTRVQVEPFLDALRREGLSDASAFYEYERAFRDQAEVTARVKRAAKRCKAPSTPPASSP